MRKLTQTLRGEASTLPFVRPLNDLAIADPLAAITAVAKLRDALDDAEALAVTVARTQQGLTWADLGEHIGLPLTTVHRRFRHLDPR